jgi:exopolysaccharide biosynthesis polyprenyl glycosylphosphotransferase
MNLSGFKASILCIGDVLLLYASLALALFFRYNVRTAQAFVALFNLHFSPFTIVFVIWIIVFYLADLYDPKNFKNNLDFYRSFLTALVINGLLAVAFFYIFTFYGISPKVVLFILLVIFVVIDLIWRYLFNRYSGITGTKENVAIIMPSDRPEMANEIISFIKANPQLGYEIKCQLNDERDYKNLSETIKENSLDLIVIPTRYLKQKPELAKEIYRNLSLGINVINLSEFYESIFKKVPLSELEEAWFLEHVVHLRHFYDSIKRSLGFIEALILIVVLSPFLLLIALLVKLTSSGPAIYRQIRVGKDEKPFILYKFRTMRADAEKHGPQWSAGSDDPRVTGFGRFLRYTHLDETPQLFNILKGDVYFVGPRPERPEFVKQLKERIPYYDIRHLITPGISGWAQINYRYGSSTEDAVQKLQYEIYYMENRSFIFDLIIVAKTIKMLFLNFE